MSASNAFEDAQLKLFLQNVDITGIGDSGGIRGSATAGSIYAVLCTADPGEAGTAVTNEVAYTGYARAAIARSTGAWNVSNGVGSNAVAVNFPARTDSGAAVTATHIALVSSASGAGMILWSGPMNSPSSISITQGIAPSFAAGVLTVTVD